MKKSILMCLFIGLAASAATGQKPYKAYMVSNAHFDTQWNWDVQESINVYIPSTMEQNFWLFEHYPEYIFNFEGGVKYSWMKEYYPEMFERVKEYVRSGRWNVCGSSWDANDPNMPSSESFFRNILLGQQFYREEFGVTGNDIFLPDCFGFGYALPTIAAHAGLKGFSTQKLQWRKHNFYGNSKVPFSIGLWQGIDGSKIMAALNAGDYTARWDAVDLSNDEGIIELAKKGPDNIAYRYYGTGDRGGSPTIPSVVSLQKGIRGNGPVEIVSARAGQIYDDFYPFDRHPELPVYDGELLMDVHATGCYTSEAAMKRFNRRNEQLADAAERASVVADWLGTRKYPAEEIRTEWRRFIWHQFHDDLTGTSIPRAYTFSWNDELIAQSKFRNIAISASEGVAKKLYTQVKGIPLVIYNPSGHTRTEIVDAWVPMSEKPRAAAVFGPDGKAVKSQTVGYSDGKLHIAFAATVGSVGYAVYDLRTSGGKEGTALKATASTLENGIYKVTLDSVGDICSIVDKRNGKELVASGKSFRLALFTENRSTAWPAWEILKETIDREPTAITDNVAVSVEELGAVRATLKVSRSYGESRFVQYISLTDGGADDMITVRNEVDWRAENALLKAEFPTSLTNREAAYDLGVGYIKRPNNTANAYEVVAQQWADLTDADGSYGVAVMNDCKYGWDKPDDHTLRLTLLHTPSTGRDFDYQSRQDIGRHYFSYAITGHADDIATGRIASEALALNQPMSIFVADKHSGRLGRNFSFLSSDNPQIVVKAVKMAEDGTGYVIRVNEISGKDVQNASIVFAVPIWEAFVLNGVEERQGAAEFKGNSLTFSCGKFAPSTFFVKLQLSSIFAPKAAVSAAVALPYNGYAFTPNAFNRRGDIDGHGNSYAAELVPDRIVSEGVEFEIDNDPSAKNYVRCDGQSIPLPQGGYDRIYLLAASADKDRTAEFTVGGKTFDRFVPYYSGFYGQWGHDGKEGYVKDADIARVFTHRHSKEFGNEAYVFTYMYKICLPLDNGAAELILPKDKNIMLFAATLAGGRNESLTPVNEVRALP